MKKKTVVINQIKYLLNDKDMTAFAMNCEMELIDLNIPASIIYQSKEYSVSGLKYGISMYSVKSITIPSSIKFIDSKFFAECQYLIEINLSSDNKDYSLYENKFIIGKSSENENENDFNVLVFCVRNVKNVVIPKFIKSIGPYSFQNCKQIDEIIFEPNSKLERIGKCAFQNSSIKTLVTPPSLKIICRKAFENCDQLKLVEIPMDSEIHTIQRYAFALSSIESINITSKLVNLEKFWCSDTPKLTTFKVSPDSPMYLSYDDKFIIGKTLTFKEIEEDYDESEEEEEEEEEFKDEDVKEEIEKENYEDKEGLIDDESKEVFKKEISEEEDMRLQSNKLLDICSHENEHKIDSNEFNILIFSVRNIVEASIPSFIKIIGPCSFNQCTKLKKVEFTKNSKLQKIDKGAFSFSSLKSIFIPTNVTIIQYAAFAACYNLTNVEFSVNSKLQKIGQFAFINSGINNIHIPASLINIEKGAFIFCSKLQKIDIPSNSQLKKIKYSAFQNTSITSFFIPSKVKDIEYNNFDKIQIVEVDQNFENIKYLHDFFYNNKLVIIMIPSRISNLCHNISK